MTRRVTIEDDPGSFDGLPEVLREIAEAAGLDAAMKLAWSRGGSIVYIPHRVGPKHWLTECVGRKAADAICDHFRILNPSGRQSGARLHLPLGGTGVLAQAKRRCAALLIEQAEAGEVSVPRAARQCGLSERTAFRIWKRMGSPGDDRQGRLF